MFSAKQASLAIGLFFPRKTEGFAQSSSAGTFIA
jgi:hypothetical protein